MFHFKHRIIKSGILSGKTDIHCHVLPGVDDGSPDNCPDICEEYAEKDSRVRVIHKENGGLSDARNAGTDIAKGEYISYIDSDDWIDSETIKLTLEKMLEVGAEIGAFNVLVVYEGEQVAEGKKSMAFTVTFTPKDEEFTAESVDGYVHKILKNLKKELDIELRV